MSSSFGDQSAAGQPAAVPLQQASSTAAADLPMGGWVMFSAVVILINGAFNVFDGFVGFFRATYYIGSPFAGSGVAKRARMTTRRVRSSRAALRKSLVETKPTAPFTITRRPRPWVTLCFRVSEK